MTAVPEERVAAELEIRNLIAALAINADIGEIDDYTALFTEDAVWEMPANPAMGLEASVKTGRSDIAAGVRERRSSGVQGPGSGTWHSITTQQIEVSGDEASGRVYYQFLGKVDGKPSLLTLGRYADRYVRTADGWRLAHRTIHLG
jgi:3-phenylpropionate/cinnamic acid dioxygenase small subunit